MFRSVELRKACCAIRKVEPLARMLSGRTAWVTGLRREQSAERAVVPFTAQDADGRSRSIHWPIGPGRMSGTTSEPRSPL